MAEDWQTQKFRQNVIAKINEILQTTGQDPTKNPSVMESHIFKKSRNKDEYLGLVAKLFIHFKELAQRRPQQPPPTEMNQQNIMQDPLNALQNLAAQGNRNPQIMSMPGVPGTNQMTVTGGPVMSSNILQTLNQQRPGQQMQQIPGIRGQISLNNNSLGTQNHVPNLVSGGQQMVNQMGSNIGTTGMQISVMGSGPQAQMVGNVQQMTGLVGQIGQINPSGPGTSGTTVTGVSTGASNQLQMNVGQMQSGPINVNSMNVQQMSQMQQVNQNQMNMGMSHSQLNQMMSARIGQNGPLNVSSNMPSQGIQAMPPSVQQGQVGSIHPNSVVNSQQAQVGANITANSTQNGNLNQMINMQQKPNMSMTQGGLFSVNRSMISGQQQYLRQSPSPSTVPSPANMGSNQQLQQQQQSGSVPQQAQVPQLSNQQMIPSPALVPSSSPQMSNLMQNNQRNLRQSPSAPLNTPGQIASNSPFNPQEDQLYREKYKQLTKYIEPLKRMVAKIGNDGTNVEKITKMSKLLEILSNPAQRVPLETLLKCEKALEKMEIVSYSGQQFAKSTNPLMEVMSTTLQSPIANHSLSRTFRPSLELLFGTDVCAPLISRVQEKNSQFEHEIPHILQGEIARLDQKFKITLDTTVQNNAKSIKLICCLDDKCLPNVPPINVNIPDEYPWASPECSIIDQEYMSTPFLNSVQSTLLSRIAKLPKCYSLSHLLDTWEISVRQSCSPTIKSTHDLINILNG